MFNNQKTLQEVIKLSRTSGDFQGVLIQTYDDVKKELKSQDPQTQTVALQKLFFLKTENVDLSALEFQIINCLGSSNFTLKRMACLQSCTSVDPFSQSIFMSTNIFKKEMMKSNHIEVSCILNCLTNIVDKEMGPRVIDEAMKLLKSTNILIRKKALVLVASIFTHAPQTITGNLEIILNQIIPQEQNPTVLACFTSVVQTVLNTQPKLYPLFVKPLYDILQKQKSNWFMIKLIKTFHKMVKLEPRLIKKLSGQYLNILQNNKSKALEYEVLSSTIEYFQEEKELYELACQKLRNFIEHKDGNLRNLGFILLNKTIQGNISILEEYKEFLIQTFEQATDLFTKLQILEIFQNYINRGMFKNVIEAVLENIEKEKNKKLYSKVIEFVIFLAQKNDFELINDFDWLINKVIYQICKFAEDLHCAELIQQLIYSIMVRVDGTKQLIFNLSINVIKFLNESSDQNTYQNNKSNYLNIPDISAQEKIFQTLVFLIGEHSNLIKDKDNLKALFKFFNQEKILLKYSFSYNEIQSTLLKLFVNYTQNLQNENEMIEECNQLYQSLIEIIKKIYSQTQQIDLSQQILFQTLNPECEKLEQITIDSSNILQVQTLRNIFEEFQPIHPDAQECAEPEENLNLNEEFQKDEQEIKKIADLCSQFFTTQKKKSEVPSQPIQKSDSNIIENNNQENQNNAQNQKEQIQQKQEEQEQPKYVIKGFADIPNNKKAQKKKQKQDESDEEDD